ncbi:MAG: acyltransferase family protein [Motiliproteus sp.]
MQQQSPQISRRYELDWMRVLAFGLLITFHIGMFYVADWGWHVKSEHSSDWLQYPMLWSNQWRMSLLFFISGAASYYLIRKQGGWHFYLTRHSRLLLPLLIGIAVVIPPQLYWEIKQAGQLGNLNYWQFWGAYFDFNHPAFDGYKAIMDTNLTWTHLWFLFYVFIYGGVAALMTPILKFVAKPLELGALKCTTFSKLVLLLVAPLYFVFTDWLLAGTRNPQIRPQFLL